MKNRTSKTCLIRQPAGIGDIFFTQKIAKNFKDKGYEILWPVVKDFYWIKDYIDGINFVLEEDNFILKDVYSDIKNNKIIESKNYIFVPLHGNYANDKSIMVSKYKSVNIEYDDWVDYLYIKRNREKENKLFYDILNIKNGEEYIFVNDSYASPPNILYKTIKYPIDKRIIKLKFIDGFTLIDWLKVLENAIEIYTVETSLNYLIEKYNMKAKKMIMYSKWNPPHFYHINMLFKKKWEYSNE